MGDKCFCHLNGYRVKDAEARQRITQLEEDIKNIEIPEVSGEGSKGYYEYEMPLGICPTSETGEWINTNLSEECFSVLDEMINKLKQDNVSVMTLVIKNTSKDVEWNGEIVPDGSPRLIVFDECIEFEETIGDTIVKTYSFDGTRQRSQNSNKQISYENKFVLTVNYNNGVIVSASISSTVVRYIPTNNQDEYIPTDEYNPATKKYVDDAISSVEVNGVDLTGYATEDYVDNSISTIELPNISDGILKYVDKTSLMFLDHETETTIDLSSKISELQPILNSLINNIKEGKACFINLSYTQNTNGGYKSNVLLEAQTLPKDNSNSNDIKFIGIKPIKIDKLLYFELKFVITHATNEDGETYKKIVLATLTIKNMITSLANSIGLVKTTITGTATVTDNGVLQFTTALPSGWTYDNCDILHAHYVRADNQDRVLVSRCALINTNYVWLKVENSELVAGDYTVKIVLMKI